MVVTTFTSLFVICFISSCNCKGFKPRIFKHEGILRRETKNFTLDNGISSSIPLLTPDREVNGLRRYPCYIRVKTYRSSLKSYAASNVPVYVLTKEPSTNQYIGYAMATTNINGTACVLTLCGKNVRVFADTGVEKLFLFNTSNQRLPSGLNFSITSQTEAFVWDVEEIPNFFEPPGPIYTRGFLQMCLSNQIDYSISFHFLGIPDKLTKANNSRPLDVSTAWYPYMPGESQYRVCYLKVKIQINAYNVTLSVDSINGVSGFWYGNFVAGPKEDPKNTDSANRAACVEYRCPYTSDLDGTEIPTNLTGKLIVPPGVQCTSRNVASDLKTFNISNNGFKFSLAPDDDYGPKAGIYNSADSRLARHLCFTGSNALDNNQYEMNPDTYFAFEYACK